MGTPPLFKCRLGLVDLACACIIDDEERPGEAPRISIDWGHGKLVSIDILVVTLLAHGLDARTTNGR